VATAAAAIPATAAATFRRFAFRRFPRRPAIFDASDFALLPARFADCFALLADFLMLAMDSLRGV
jgi:hypothetical protein